MIDDSDLQQQGTVTDWPLPRKYMYVCSLLAVDLWVHVHTGP